MVRYLQACLSPFSCLNAALTDLKIAMSSMSALINYLDLTRDENNFGHFNLKQYTMGQYMRLDASAVQALSLLPNARETGSNKNMNLLGLLNKCKTAQGSRLIGQWLKQPLVNVHEISSYSHWRLWTSTNSFSEKRQNLVEVFVKDANARRSVQVCPPLPTICLPHPPNFRTNSSDICQTCIGSASASTRNLPRLRTLSGSIKQLFACVLTETSIQGSDMGIAPRIHHFSRRH